MYTYIYIYMYIYTHIYIYTFKYTYAYIDGRTNGRADKHKTTYYFCIYPLLRCSILIGYQCVSFTLSFTFRSIHNCHTSAKTSMRNPFEIVSHGQNVAVWHAPCFVVVWQSRCCIGQWISMQLFCMRVAYAVVWHLWRYIDFRIVVWSQSVCYLLAIVRLCRCLA